METLAFRHTLLEYYNVFFLCAFAFAMIFLILQAIGVMGDHASFEADADVDLDADVASNDLDTTAGPLSKALSFFGIGKAPIGIWLFVFFFVFGLSGLVANLLLFQSNPSQLAGLFPITLIGSLFIALFLGKYISAFIARLFPKESSHSIGSPYELIHQRGKVRFRLDLEDGGSIAVIDSYGNLQNVQAQLDTSVESKAPLEEGTVVNILDYDASKGVFIVAPSMEK